MRDCVMFNHTHKKKKKQQQCSGGWSVAVVLVQPKEQIFYHNRTHLIWALSWVQGPNTPFVSVNLCIDSLKMLDKTPLRKPVSAE